MTEEFADINDIENADTSVSDKPPSDFVKIPYLPKGKAQTWPIIMRIVVNRLRSEAKPYHATHVHPVPYGEKFVNVPCLRTFDEGCPFCDAFWGYKEKMDDMVAKGWASDSALPANNTEYKKMQTLSQVYSKRKQYTSLVVLPKDDSIYQFFMGPMLLKKIFGDADKKERGAIQELKSDFGVPVFNSEESVGWIKVNRTGQKLETRYTACPAVVEVVNGRMKSTQLMEEPLTAPIKVKLEANDIPRILETFKSRCWSAEEMENFVASGGTQLPERIAKFYQDKEEKPSESLPVGKVEATDFKQEIEEMDAF